MAVIAFSDEDVWSVARWAFEQLLDRAELKLGDAPEFRAELEQAKALDGLHLDMLPPPNREEIVLALATAARELAGELANEPQDPLGEGFIEALWDLDARLGSHR